MHSAPQKQRTKRAVHRVSPARDLKDAFAVDNRAETIVSGVAVAVHSDDQSMPEAIDTWINLDEKNLKSDHAASS